MITAPPSNLAGDMDQTDTVPFAIDACRQDRGRRAEHEGNVAIPYAVDFRLHFSLLRQVWPIGDHGHYAVLANADEDMSSCN